MVQLTVYGMADVIEAFRVGSRKKESLSPELSWLQLQCSQTGLYPPYEGDTSKLTILDRQTCRRWKSVMELERVKHPLRQRRRTVLIQPLTYLSGSHTPLDAVGAGAAGGEEEQEREAEYRHTHISDTVLEMLRGFCVAYFSEMEVRLAPPIDLSEIPRLTSRVHKRTNRRQFLVGDIIHFLSSRKLKNAYCVIGVTVVDLYPGPEWNFVLGQAHMEKGSGVFSFGRYFNSSRDTIAGRDRKSGTVGVESSECGGCGGGGGVEPDDEDERDEWEREQIRNLWVLMRVRSLGY